MSTTEQDAGRPDIPRADIEALQAEFSRHKDMVSNAVSGVMRALLENRPVTLDFGRAAAPVNDDVTRVLDEFQRCVQAEDDGDRVFVPVGDLRIAAKALSVARRQPVVVTAEQVRNATLVGSDRGSEEQARAASQQRYAEALALLDTLKVEVSDRG